MNYELSSPVSPTQMFFKTIFAAEKTFGLLPTPIHASTWEVSEPAERPGRRLGVTAAAFSLPMLSAISHAAAPSSA